MNTGDLLTVKEFAEAAGITTQRVYQLTKSTLKEYTKTIAKGKKHGIMLHKDGLQVLTCKELAKDLQREETQTGSGIEGNSTKCFANDLQNDLQRELINGLKSELESLHAHIDSLQQQHAAELAEKNAQIKMLQEHTENQQQTIQALTAMLHPQQQLNAAAAVIQKQLIDQSGAADTETEGGSSGHAADTQGETPTTEGKPKRGLFARIFGKK